jgi:hypothetical protein
MPGLESFFEISSINMWVHAFVLICVLAVSITSFALLIPLDSVPAVTGVSIIIGLAYGVSFIAWTIVMWWYASKPENLVWLNTHVMFLVAIPATIAATAMNVTSIQNTRNLLAGTITNP